jgi:hypothetical protein
MKKYPVIAELVDVRDRSRHFPAAEGEDTVYFVPADEEHAKRLINAGCLKDEPTEVKRVAPVPTPAVVTTPVNDLDGKTVEPVPTQAVTEPVDDLDGKTVAQLKEVVAAEAIDLGEAKLKADILAAIRAHRSAKAAQ